MKKNTNISSDVKINSGNFVADYSYKLPTDIINIIPPQLYRSDHGNHVYWFGYRFNDDISSKQRTQFINYVKGIGDNSMPDRELERFIQLPLGELNNQINLYQIDCIVYPLSNRSELVRKMVSAINNMTSREAGRLSFELVKSAPTNIEFDWDMFESENRDDENKYNQMKQYVEQILLPAIHNLDYFSIANSVKPKYRKYITNFLSMSKESMERLSKLKGNNILVVDDINTSGSTLDEILRIIGKINQSCNVYVYTLIGK